MTLAHPLQENRLIAAVMDKVRIHDLRKDAVEIVPYQLLLFCIVPRVDAMEIDNDFDPTIWS